MITLSSTQSGNKHINLRTYFKTKKGNERIAFLPKGTIGFKGLITLPAGGMITLSSEQNGNKHRDLGTQFKTKEEMKGLHSYPWGRYSNNLITSLTL